MHKSEAALIKNINSHKKYPDVGVDVDVDVDVETPAHVLAVV